MKPLRLIAFLLALLLFCLPLIACGNDRGDTLLTLERDGTTATFSANHYWFLLSRLKGSFVSRGVTNDGGNASKAAFWEVQEYFDGDNTLKTWDTYYREQILENAKIYLIGLWIFEKKGLSLSNAKKDEIKQTMEDALTYNGNGSKVKLNAELKPFGLNYELLESFYEIEAKLEGAMNYLYGENASRLGTTVKDDYLNRHYYRFQRIFLPFYTETEADVQEMTDEEKVAVRAEAEALLAELQPKSDTEFASAATEKNGAIEYTDGYYIPTDAAIGNNAEQIAFFSTIRERLSSMEIGDTALLEMSDGIQILRRCEPTSGAYDKDVNAAWFGSFATNLMAELFAKECGNYLSGIALDEAAFAEVPALKEISPNYYF